MIRKRTRSRRRRRRSFYYQPRSIPRVELKSVDHWTGSYAVVQSAIWGGAHNMTADGASLLGIARGTARDERTGSRAWATKMSFRLTVNVDRSSITAAAHGTATAIATPTTVCALLVLDTQNNEAAVQPAATQILDTKTGTTHQMLMPQLLRNLDESRRYKIIRRYVIKFPVTQSEHNDAATNFYCAVAGGIAYIKEEINLKRLPITWASSSTTNAQAGLLGNHMFVLINGANPGTNPTITAAYFARLHFVEG